MYTTVLIFILSAQLRTAGRKAFSSDGEHRLASVSTSTRAYPDNLKFHWSIATEAIKAIAGGTTICISGYFFELVPKSKIAIGKTCAKTFFLNKKYGRRVYIRL